MHHDICNGAIWESFGVEFWVGVVLGGVGEFTTEENTSVTIHGSLRWNGGIEFPHDDGFGVVDKILSYTWKVVYDGNVKVFELLSRPNSREEHKTTGIDCASTEDSFGLRGDGEFLAGFQGYVYALDSLAGVKIKFADPGIGEDGQVWSTLSTAENWVDVSDRSRTSSSIIWVI